MLTAKDGEVDKVVRLEVGADDYVTKPYPARELIARIHAVLRRAAKAEGPLPTLLQAGPVLMDLEQHTVSDNGEEIHFPLKEFQLLAMLLQHPGWALTRTQLIDRVWGAQGGDSKTLDVHIQRIRHKIEPDPHAPSYLKTVRRLGYTFGPASSGTHAAGPIAPSDTAQPA